jgi:hypothetical protein
MKLVIDQPVPVEETPTDSYVVVIESMQGDADGYRKFTVGPFLKNKDEAPLQSLLETLKRMMDIHGRDYNEVLGFQQWFGEFTSIEDLQNYYPNVISKYGVDVNKELIAMTENHFSEWHGDATANYQYLEKITGYWVFYYDEKAVKHTVQVHWDI